MNTDDVDMLRQARRIYDKDAKERDYTTKQRATNNYIQLIKDCTLATSQSNDPIYKRIGSRLDVISSNDAVYPERIRKRAKALIGAEPTVMLDGVQELVYDLRTPKSSNSIDIEEAVHYDPVPDFIRHADALAVSAYAYRANPESGSHRDQVVFRVASLMTPIIFAGNVSSIVPRSVAFLRLREYNERLQDMNAKCGELVIGEGMDTASASVQITMIASEIVSFASSLLTDGNVQTDDGNMMIGGKGGADGGSENDEMFGLIQRLFDQTRTIEAMVESESYFAASAIASNANRTCEYLRSYTLMQSSTHAQRLLVIAHAIRSVDVTPDTMGLIEDDEWKRNAREQSQVAVRQVKLLANAIGFRLEVPAPSEQKEDVNQDEEEPPRSLKQLAVSFRDYGRSVDREYARSVVKASTDAIESDDIKAEAKQLRKRLRHDSASADELAEMVEHLDLSIEETNN